MMMVFAVIGGIGFFIWAILGWVLLYKEKKKDPNAFNRAKTALDEAAKTLSQQTEAISQNLVLTGLLEKENMATTKLGVQSAITEEVRRWVQNALQGIQPHS